MPLVRQILVRVIMGRKRQLFNTGTGNQYKRDGERGIKERFKGIKLKLSEERVRK